MALAPPPRAGSDGNGKGAGSRSYGARSGLNFLLLLKIDFWCRLGTTDTKNRLFLSYIWYQLAYPETQNMFPVDPINPFYSSVFILFLNRNIVWI
jgi:hypothetical protein